ncbi:MAG: enoyl-CoA hydratase/isomerase family protein [Pseudomonadota bacterium]
MPEEVTATSAESEPLVLVRREAAGARYIGRLTLNSPSTLNSLTLEMVDAIQGALDGWLTDPEVALVLIDATGEKAFCAGGDVQALHASSVGTPGGPCEYAEEFFAREYRMNYTLHTYPKPVVCLGHGIVMGGGLGIHAACSHRVVTETTRIAMPEVTIALFPDVGGSYFLNRAPGATGRFLALTAASINAADAIFCGFADRFIPAAQLESVVAALLAEEWDGDIERDHARTREILRGFSEAHQDQLPSPQVQPHLAKINRLCDGTDVHDVIDRICTLETDDRWLTRSRDGLAHGSKLAALWIYRQLVVARHLSLKEIFQSELQLATNIMRHPEFGEGVRALLIDKDRSPKWSYERSRDVPAEVLDGFFTSPWTSNPLSGL